MNSIGFAIQKDTSGCYVRFTSSVLPARWAARLDPVRALRDEWTINGREP